MHLSKSETLKSFPSLLSQWIHTSVWFFLNSNRSYFRSRAAPQTRIPHHNHSVQIFAFQEPERFCSRRNERSDRLHYKIPKFRVGHLPPPLWLLTTWKPIRLNDNDNLLGVPFFWGAKDRFQVLIKKDQFGQPSGILKWRLAFWSFERPFIYEHNEWLAKVAWQTILILNFDPHIFLPCGYCHFCFLSCDPPHYASWIRPLITTLKEEFSMWFGKQIGVPIRLLNFLVVIILVL